MTATELRVRHDNKPGVDEIRAAGGYSIIYADPAWAYDDSKNPRGGAENHYVVTETRDLFRLPVWQIAAQNSYLFMWATYPMLEDALRVMTVWGFVYKTIAFQWVKLKPKGEGYFMGGGHYTRANSEPCLLGVRGKLERLDAGVSQLIVTPRGEHSAKPPEARDRIVRLYGNVPRIELFAREKVPGWDAWGNEIDSDVRLP